MSVDLESLKQGKNRPTTPVEWAKLANKLDYDTVENSILKWCAKAGEALAEARIRKNYKLLASDVKFVLIFINLNSTYSSYSLITIGDMFDIIGSSPLELACLSPQGMREALDDLSRMSPNSITTALIIQCRKALKEASPATSVQKAFLHYKRAKELAKHGEARKARAAFKELENIFYRSTLRQKLNAGKRIGGKNGLSQSNTQKLKRQIQTALKAQPS